MSMPTGNGHGPPQGQPLPFGLLPVTTRVMTASTPVGDRVVLVVETPQGTSGFFLDAGHARALSGELATAAGAAASGLTVVGRLDGEPEPEA